MNRKTIFIIIITIGVLVGVYFLIQYLKKGKFGSNDAQTGLVIDYSSYPLKKGSRGKAVQLLQLSLDITADGIFGPQTLGAVVDSTKYSNGEVPKDFIWDSWFNVSEIDSLIYFPLNETSSSPYVSALKVLIGIPDLSEKFTPVLLSAVKTALKTELVSVDQWKALGKTILNYK